MQSRQAMGSYFLLSLVMLCVSVLCLALILSPTMLLLRLLEALWIVAVFFGAGGALRILRESKNTYPEYRKKRKRRPDQQGPNWVKKRISDSKGKKMHL